MNFKKSIKLIEEGFETYFLNTPEFIAFSKVFKKELIASLKNNGKITKFHIGHFEISGFIRDNKDYCYYFSLSDVRYFPKNPILIRRAETV